MTMFCRCTHCNKQRQISARELRTSRGLLKCRSCGQSFDALASLSEKPDEAQPRYDKGSGFAFGPTELMQASRLWTIGSVVMLVVLLAQVVYFDGRRLYGQPVVNVALAKVCRALNCRPPIFNDPEQWAVSHTELEPHLDNRYWLVAALTNQAKVTQALPNLKLTLTNFGGQPLAERVFLPYQYSADTQLAANETVLVRLPLIMANDEIGGYTLDTL
ncbi:zinc-ribbon and DUF3426 domain-containing protein [Methylomonas sp. MgM2]